MARIKRPSPSFKVSSLGIYLAGAGLTWSGLIWFIFNIPPGQPQVYLAFFGLLTTTVACSLISLLTLLTQLFYPKGWPVRRRIRRRAWFLGLGISVLGILQLLRIISFFNAALVVIILILVEIYLSQ